MYLTDAIVEGIETVECKNSKVVLQAVEQFTSGLKDCESYYQEILEDVIETLKEDGIEILR